MKTYPIFSAAFFASFSSSVAATVTGLVPTTTGTTTTTAIIWDNGMVSSQTALLPITNKGSYYNTNPIESKWWPDKFTLNYYSGSTLMQSATLVPTSLGFSHNLGGSGGTANAGYGAQNLNFFHFDSQGTRSVLFGQTSGSSPWASMSNLTSSMFSKWSLSPGTEGMERRTVASPSQAPLIRVETDLVPTTGTIEVNGQAGTSDGITQFLTNSPVFLWSGSYNNGATVADFPVMRAGGSNHLVEVFKRPANFTAVGTTNNPVIVLDPMQEKIFINGQAVAVSNSPGVFGGLTVTGGTNITGNTNITGGLASSTFATSFAAISGPANVSGASTFNSARTSPVGSNTLTVRTNTDYSIDGAGVPVIPAIPGQALSNSLRITEEGVILIKPQSGIPMGAFVNGPRP